MSTISMFYLCIQYIVGAPRNGKYCSAIEQVILNCLYNYIWVRYQCIWEEDRVRTQHSPVVASKERFNMDCVSASPSSGPPPPLPQSAVPGFAQAHRIHSGHREAKPTAFTFRAQRGVWKVNFAFWPTGLKVTLLAICWRAASWPHRLCWGMRGHSQALTPELTQLPLQHQSLCGTPGVLPLLWNHTHFTKTFTNK